jgi:ubiquitin carboxyl-terminal hydrolase 5/13
VTKTFKFMVEQKLKCNECGGVRLKVNEEESISIPVPARIKPSDMDVDEKGKEKVDGASESASKAAAQAKETKVDFEPVELEECLDLLTAVHPIEYKCPKCQKSVVASQCVIIFPLRVILLTFRPLGRLISRLFRIRW